MLRIPKPATWGSMKPLEWIDIVILASIALRRTVESEAGRFKEAILATALVFSVRFQLL